MEDSAIHHPHDTLVRTVLRRPTSAEAFLRVQLGRLHPGLVGHLDWTGLRQPTGAFVDGTMRGLHTDLIYEIPFRAREAVPLHCLVEHQSQPDARMALRLLGYMTAFLNHWRVQHPQEQRLPWLVPIVFYTGRRRWRVPTRLRDLCGMPAGAGPLPHLLDLTYLLATLIVQAPGDAVLATMQTLMHAMERGRGKEWLDRHAEMLQDLEKEADGEALARLFVRYLFRAGKGPSYSTIREKLGQLKSKSIREEAMNAAEELMQMGHQKGLQKGLQEGRQEGARIGQIRFCQRILGQEPTPEEILSDYSLDELDRLARSLEQQVFSTR